MENRFSNKQQMVFCLKIFKLSLNFETLSNAKASPGPILPFSQSALLMIKTARITPILVSKIFQGILPLPTISFIMYYQIKVVKKMESLIETGSVMYP